MTTTFPSIWDPTPPRTVESRTILSAVQIPVGVSGALVFVSEAGISDYYSLNLTSGAPVDGTQILATSRGGDSRWVRMNLPATMSSLSGTILLWGNDGVLGTTTTRFLTPCYEAETARTTAVAWRCPRAGSAKNLRVRQNVGAGNGNAIVYTLLVNGVVSLLSVSMASTANDGSDLVNVAPIAVGDLLTLRVTKAASIGASPSNIVASMELAA
jgi:hypothetical protein